MKNVVMLVILVTLSLVADSFAVEMTREMRDNAAKMHDEMAICLRSDKTMEECHNEMKASCTKVMGEKECPMMKGMGMMMKNKGMKHHKKKMHEAAPAPVKK